MGSAPRACVLLDGGLQWHPRRGAGRPLGGPQGRGGPRGRGQRGRGCGARGGGKAADDAYNGGRANTVAAMAHVILANYHIAHRIVRTHGRFAPPPPPHSVPSVQVAAAAQAAAREVI